jgi:hypothetical protein
MQIFDPTDPFDPLHLFHHDQDGDHHHNDQIAGLHPHHHSPLDDHGQHAEGYEGVVVGTPLEDAKHFRAQTGDYTCAAEAQAAVLEAITGQHVSELDAAVESAQFGLLTTAGTLPENIGKWLEYHGIECHANGCGTFRDIIQELRDGHKVIVDVDSNVLWHTNDSLHAFSKQAADHAIWLTGVDTTDPDHVKVTINDSGKIDGAGNVYDLHDLEHVLNHPGFHYVATGHGPSHLPDHPQGYDEQHGIFSALDGFLHEHPAAVAAVGIAATAGLIASNLQNSWPQGEQSENPIPLSRVETLPRPSARPELNAPPPRALPDPSPLEGLTRAERDALILKA